MPACNWNVFIGKTKNTNVVHISIMSDEYDMIIVLFFKTKSNFSNIVIREIEHSVTKYTEKSQFIWWRLGEKLREVIY